MGVGTTGHEDTFFGARVGAQITIAAFGHIDIETGHQQAQGGTVGGGPQIHPLGRLDGLNLDAIHRAGAHTLQAADTVIHVHVQPGANAVVTGFLEADGSLGYGPALPGELQGGIKLLFMDEVPHRYPHPVPERAGSRADIAEVAAHFIIIPFIQKPVPRPRRKKCSPGKMV